MSEKLDLFELSVKRGLENYEVPMEEGAWESFQTHMNTGSSSAAQGGSSFLGKFGVAAAVLTAVGLFINFSSNNEQAYATLDHSVTDQHVDGSHDSSTEAETAYVLESLESDETSSVDEMTIADEQALEAEEKRLVNINKKLQEAADRAETEEKELEKKTTTRYVGTSFNLDAPSEFSPNGDGKLDNFLPNALKDGDRFTLIITDNDGNRVFRSSQVDQPWDGKDLAGIDAVEGLYTWEVTLHKDNNNKEIFRGIVKLDR